jgi:hypothetical protein
LNPVPLRQDLIPLPFFLSFHFSQLINILPTILELDVEFEVEFKLIVSLTLDGGVTTFESLNLFNWLVTPPTTPEMVAQMTIMRINLVVLASLSHTHQTYHTLMRI